MRRVHDAISTRPRVRGGARATRAACAALAAGLLLSACGGGSGQDVGEPHASFDVKVLRASFPATQAVARPATLELVVQNSGAHAVPNIAVSVDSFNYASDYPNLADNKRPIWAIERGPGAKAEPPVETQEVSTPGGAQTNYVNTWALGRLAPGQTRTFVWRVVAVKPGTHTVHFTFAAGLAGRAKIVASSGSLSGALTVKVAPAPPLMHVDPVTGKLVPGPYVPSY